MERESMNAHTVRNTKRTLRADKIGNRPRHRGLRIGDRGKNEQGAERNSYCSELACHESESPFLFIPDHGKRGSNRSHRHDFLFAEKLIRDAWLINDSAC